MTWKILFFLQLLLTLASAGFLLYGITCEEQKPYIAKIGLVVFMIAMVSLFIIKENAF